MSPVAVLDDVIIPITVDYLEEDQIFQVSCPWLQGCHAWGETLDEAMRAIPGNIRAMVDARRQKGSPVPSQLEAMNSSKFKATPLWKQNRDRLLCDLSRFTVS